MMTSFNSSWSGFVISFCFPLFFWIETWAEGMESSESERCGTVGISSRSSGWRKIGHRNSGNGLGTSGFGWVLNVSSLFSPLFLASRRVCQANARVDRGEVISGSARLSKEAWSFQSHLWPCRSGEEQCRHVLHIPNPS